MKKLITIWLLIATAFTTNAQNGKPTKEQTVEYIKSFFSNRYFHIRYFGHAKAKVADKYTFEMNGNDIIISYNLYNYDGNNVNEFERQTYTINIKDIESISKDKTYVKESEEFDNIYQIVFKTFNKKESIIHLSNGVMVMRNYSYIDVSNASHPQEDLDKVIKALNHLRKLCGAPEPISFD